MDVLRRDIGYALRMMRRSPGFTLAAALTLAFGIGANVAIFTLVDAILLRPLPVREPQRLVLFSGSTKEGTSTGTVPKGRWQLFSTEVYDHLRRQPLPFASLAAVRSGQDTVAVRFAGESRDDQRGIRAQAHLVSGNYFTTLGVSAARGRVLADADDRPDAAPVAVMSDTFWRTELNSDPGIVGRVVALNGTAFTIVGLTTPEFFGERVQQAPAFWVPLVFQPQIELRASYLERPDVYWLEIIGRLRPDATRASAQTATNVALRQFLTGDGRAELSAERRNDIRESYIQLEDGSAGVSTLRRLYAAPLQILIAVVGLVLLLACSNVGNLLLSRAAARHAEMTLRVALGASRATLVRMLFTESLVLAGVGAVCGLVLARWAVHALLQLIVVSTVPVSVAIDGRVLAVTIGVTIISGVLVGLAPAIRAGRDDLAAAIKSGTKVVGSRGRRAGMVQLLVAVQIAVSLVLLVGASLFARSLMKLQQEPLGFEQDHMLLARLNPRLAGYTPATVGLFYRRLADRLAAVPSVRSVTLASSSPLSGSTTTGTAAILGRSAAGSDRVSLERMLIGPSYGDTLGIALVQGRAIGLRDTAESARVAMVNEAFVRTYFPDGQAIGEHIQFGRNPASAPVEIVGVFKDARYHGPKDEVKPIAFLPLLQDDTQAALEAEVEVRTQASPSASIGELRQALAEVDRNVPFDDPLPLVDQIAATLDSARLAARLVSLFGGLALLLACVGLYGVVAHAVSRRTTEIGLRLALGARPLDVLALIVRDTMLLAAFGLLAGVPAAFAASRLVQSQLFGLSSLDLVSFAIAVTVLVVVAGGSGLIAASRAVRVDPMIALRAE